MKNLPCDLSQSNTEKYFKGEILMITVTVI